jgi:hypothetical protein
MNVGKCFSKLEVMMWCNIKELGISDMQKEVSLANLTGRLYTKLISCEVNIRSQKESYGYAI